MNHYFNWLVKSLNTAVKIQSKLRLIPADKKTLVQTNKMIAIGGKITILKQSIDYLNKHHII